MQKNIRVNAVAPGPIWTPLIPSTFPRARCPRFSRVLSPPSPPSKHHSKPPRGASPLRTQCSTIHLLLIFGVALAFLWLTSSFFPFPPNRPLLAALRGEGGELWAGGSNEARGPAVGGGHVLRVPRQQRLVLHVRPGASVRPAAAGVPRAMPAPSSCCSAPGERGTEAAAGGKSDEILKPAPFLLPLFLKTGAAPERRRCGARLSGGGKRRCWWRQSKTARSIRWKRPCPAAWRMLRAAAAAAAATTAGAAEGGGA